MDIRLANFAVDTELKHQDLGVKGDRISMHPIVAEIIGAEVMRSLGIGAPSTVKVVEREEVESYDWNKWIFKTLTGGRLKVALSPSVLGRWSVAVAKIPGAIPLSYLRRKFGIDTAEIPFRFLGVDPRPFLGIDGHWFPVLHDGKPELPNADAFFADFEKPEDWSDVRRAIAWNSEQALAIHAARIFLGCS